MKPGNTVPEHTEINWRSRFVKAGKIRASQIVPHPQNARKHPPLQRQAVAASFDEVGQIAPILININNGYLIDGAERSWLALDQPGDVELDCWYVDLTEAEHLYALATFDPIGALATYDSEQLDSLLQEVNSDSPAIQQMLMQLASQSNLYVDGIGWDAAAVGVPSGDRSPFQQMTFTLHDKQVEMIKQALGEAKHEAEFGDNENQNSNGNALAFICERYLNG